MRKGQITIFIVLGMVLLFSFAFLIYASSLIKKANTPENNSPVGQTASVKLFTESCIENSLLTGLERKGFRDITGLKSDFDAGFMDCTGGLDSFEGVDLVEGTFSSDLELTEDEDRLIVNVHYPLDIMTESSQSTLSEFPMELDLLQTKGIETVGGKTTEQAVVMSSDDNVILTVPEETNILTTGPTELALQIRDKNDYPNTLFIMKTVYDFGPEGASFNPGITMSMKYEDSMIPPGISETSLAITYYDGSKWIRLPSTVNTAENTVTATVNHFSTFAVTYSIPPLQLVPPTDHETDARKMYLNVKILQGTDITVWFAGSRSSNPSCTGGSGTSILTAPTNFSAGDVFSKRINKRTGKYYYRACTDGAQTGVDYTESSGYDSRLRLLGHTNHETDPAKIYLNVKVRSGSNLNIWFVGTKERDKLDCSASDSAVAKFTSTQTYSAGETFSKRITKRSGRYYYKACTSQGDTITSYTDFMSTSGPGSNVKVLLWNLLKEGYDVNVGWPSWDSYRRDEAFKLIAAQDPDIMLLQEVTHGMYIDIKNAFPEYDSHYKKSGSLDSSNVIFSKLPLTDKGFFYVHQGSSRTCPFATVDGIKLYSCHMPPSRANSPDPAKVEKQRLQRIEARQNIVAQTKGQSKIILGGDFNTGTQPVDLKIYETLRQEYSACGRSGADNPDGLDFVFSSHACLTTDTLTYVKDQKISDHYAIMIHVDLDDEYNGITPGRRDRWRVARLNKIAKALRSHYGKYGSYTQPENVNSDCSTGKFNSKQYCCKGNDCKSTWGSQSDLQVLVKDGYLSKLPVDPINNQEYFFRYEPWNDGQAGGSHAGWKFEICAEHFETHRYDTSSKDYVDQRYCVSKSYGN